MEIKIFISYGHEDRSYLNKVGVGRGQRFMISKSVLRSNFFGVPSALPPIAGPYNLVVIRAFDNCYISSVSRASKLFRYDLDLLIPDA